MKTEGKRFNLGRLLNWLQEHECLSSLLAGILFSLPFIRPELFLFTYISVCLFVVALYGNVSKDDRSEDKPLKRTFRKGFIFSLGFFIPLYHWFVALYPFNGFNFTFGQSVFIIIAACVGISIYHSLFYATAFKLFALLRPSPLVAPVLLASFWALAEWVLSVGELGFSWGRVALSQIYFLPEIQTISVFGNYFVTLVVVSVGACLGLALVYRNCAKRFVSVALAIFCTNLIAGTAIYFAPEDVDKTADAVILQANISSSEKWENRGKLSEEAYFSLLEQAVEKYDADIIVMPESSIPLNYSVDSSIKERLQIISTENDVTIVVGALTVSDHNVYNSLVAIYPDGKDSNIYNKRSLAPFGEFLPYKGFFETVLPFIKDFNLSDNELSFGKGSNLIDSDIGALGGLICFDSIFEQNARESVRDGAELLVLATNDSWYKDTAGVRQHADFARLRAIENGRYIVRAANTGISMFIDTKGRVINSLGALEMGIIESDIAVSNSLTIYTLFGDTALYFSFFVVLFAIVLRVLKRYRKTVKNKMG